MAADYTLRLTDSNSYSTDLATIRGNLNGHNGRGAGELKIRVESAWGERVTVLLLRKNLYLMVIKNHTNAFYLDRYAGTTWQTKQGMNTRNLGYGGEYPELSPFRTDAGKWGIRVSGESIAAAVSRFANATFQDTKLGDQATKDCVARLVLAVSEGLRFSSIEQKVGEALDGTKEFGMLQVKDIVNDWSDKGGRGDVVVVKG